MEDLPTPYKTNNIFLDWYYDEECTKKVNPTDKVSRDLTLYASYFASNGDVINETPRVAISTDQNKDFTFSVVTKEDMTIDEVINGISIKNTTNPIETDFFDVNRVGDKYVVSGINGFNEGSSYKVTLTNDNIYYEGFNDSVREYDFTIAKNTVMNLSIQEDIIEISFSDLNNMTRNGEVVTTENLSSSSITDSTGTITGAFEYTKGSLNTGDKVALYLGAKPSERTNSSDNGNIAYVEITGKLGNVYNYKYLRSNEVIFKPDILPVNINDDLDYNLKNNQLIIEKIRMEYGEDVYQNLGLDSQTTIDIGDFIIFYSGNIYSDQKLEFYGEIKDINVNNEIYEIEYDVVPFETITATMDVYQKETKKGTELLAGSDVESIEESVVEQARESGFAEEAANYLAEVAMETESFKNLDKKYGLTERYKPRVDTGDNTEVGDVPVNTTPGKKPVVRVSKLAAMISPVLVHFEGLEGLRLTLTVGVEIIFVVSKNIEIIIGIEGMFEQEAKIDFSFDGEAIWNVWGIFPYIEDYRATAYIDVYEYTGIGIKVTLRTNIHEAQDDDTDPDKKDDDTDPDKKDDDTDPDKKDDDTDPDKKDNDTDPDKKDDDTDPDKKDDDTDPDKTDDDTDPDKDDDSNNTDEEQNKKDYDLNQVENLADEIMNIVNFSNKYIDFGQDTVAKSFAQKYSDMINNDSEWVTLFDKPLFKIGGGIDPLHILFYEFSIDFVVTVNANISLGCDFFYEEAKRNIYTVYVFSQQYYNDVIDIVEPHYEFTFYCMGTIGIRAGVRLGITIGIFDDNVASVTLSAEIGAYLRLWGFFYYHLSWYKSTGKTIEKSGAILIELGIYLEVKLKAQVFNDKYSANPTLLLCEWPIFSVGDRLFTQSFVKTDDDYGEFIMKRDNREIKLARSVFKVNALDMKTGKELNYNQSPLNFDIRFTNDAFSFDPITYKVIVNPHEGSNIEEGQMIITWKGYSVAFSSKPIRITLDLYWDNFKDGYSITFDSNGGSYVQTILGRYDAKISKVDDPVREGYIFAGWYRDKEFTIEYEIPERIKDEDVVAYAKWTPRTDIPYTVEYQLETANGSYEIDKTLSLQGTTDTFVLCDTPEYTGYITPEKQSVEVVADGTGSVIYRYARKTYTQTFSPGDAGGEMVINKLKYKDYLAAPTFSRTGYIFNGWDKEIPTSVPSENVIYKALWLEDENTSYRVEYYLQNTDGNGFHILNVQTFSGKTNSEIIIDELIRDEYLIEDGIVYRNATVSGNVTDKATVTADGRLVIKLFYTRIAHTVNFTTGYGENEVVSSNEYLYGSSIKAPKDLVRTGYVFDGWDMSSDTKVSTQDIIINALWKPSTDTKYVVNYYGQNANDDNYTLLDTVSYKGTTEAITNAEVKEYENFIFEEDNTNAIKEGLVKADGSLILSLYYIRKEFEVTWKADDIETKQSYRFGQTIKAISDPQKEGYKFEKWDKFYDGMEMPNEDIIFEAKWQPGSGMDYTVEHYTENLDGSFSLYRSTPLKGFTDEEVIVQTMNITGFTFDTDNKENILLGKVKLDGSLLLKAYYSRNVYTFNWMNDDEVFESITYKYEENIIIPINTPEKLGYTFTGWNNELLTMPAKDSMSSALWNVNKYSITIDFDNGSEQKLINQEYQTSIEKVTEPTKTGYTFIGWSEEIPTIMPAENKLIKALWKVNIYTITFDTVNGSDVASIECEYGKVITKPSNPVKDGYTFIGWDKEIPETMPLNGGTFKAIWEANSYTIVFDTDGGTSVTSITEKYGMTINIPTPPTKPGYDFVSWDKDIPETMPLNGMTIKAIWKVRTYTITINNDNGTPDTLITLDYGEIVTKPNSPIKLGYTFVSWDKEIPETMPLNGMTIKALWKVNSYTITIDNDNNTEKVVLTIDYKAKINEITKPVKEGYTFVSFDKEIPTSMPAENIEIKALWSINHYTITYDYQNGDEKVISTYAYNEAITNIITPNKEGYTFVSWSSDIPEFMPSKNIEVTALWKTNTYEITFDTKGGSLVNPIKKDYGSTIERPIDPIKTGYTFNGWIQVIPNKMPAKDLLIEASWIVNSYKIVFNTNGGSLVDEMTYNYGETITVPNDPIYEGYTFNGWSTPLPETMPAYDINTKAEWTPNDYTITFDSDNGSEVSVITGEYKSDVSVPTDPIKTGYTFIGWDKIIPEKYPAYDLVITALWRVNTYTITFDSDGGKALAPVEYTYGSSVKITKTPTKKGFTFNGWSPEVPKTMPAENLVLTALWRVNTYTITFASDGEIYEEVNGEFGASFIMPANPVKEGYTFIGWDKTVPSTIPSRNLIVTAKYTINKYTISFNSDGGTEVAAITNDYNTEVVRPENPTKVGYTFVSWDMDVPETIPSSDITLKAIWSINSYTITFNTDGGTEIAPITQEYTSVISRMPNPTKEGYTFISWDKVIPSTMPAYDMVITCSWSINSYTISFNENGGSLIDDITLDYNTWISKPSNPIKTGYTFTGWSVAIPDRMPANNMTLNAIWQANVYNVSFDGEVIEETYNTPYILPNDPVLSGYVFLGWYTEEVNGVEINSTTIMNVPNDHSIYAHWAAGISTKYTVKHYQESLNGEYVLFATDTTKKGVTDELTNVTANTYVGFTATPITQKTINGNESTIIDVYYTRNSYILTLISNLETIEIRDMKYEESISLPTTLTRTGYTFGGWDKEVPQTMDASNLTLTVVWNPIEYTITFDSNGGSQVNSITQGYETAIGDVIEPTRIGYTFVSWDTNIPSTMPLNGCTIKALWEANEYTITFDSNGGSQVNSITQGYETEVTLPDNPVRTGYTFVSWDKEFPETMPLNGLALRANWSINSYTITFDTKGGNAISPITSTYGSSYIIPDNPVKEGYEFVSWNIDLPETIPAENITVNAIWNILEYTISFDTDGGNEITPITINYGETVPSVANPVKDYYDFNGWDQDIPEVMPASDLTIKATWIGKQYVLSYDNLIDEVVTITYRYGDNINPLPRPTRVGFIFLGWDNTVPSTMPHENIVFVAQYEMIIYHIVFNTNGGSDVPAINQGYNTTVISPVDPVKSGFTFIGWYSDSELTTEYTFSKMPKEDITLYAKWSTNAYKITIELDGGTGVSDVTANFGDTLVRPQNPTKTGYTFTGWDIEYPQTMPASNLTITALWVINQYQITIKAKNQIILQQSVDYKTIIEAPNAPVIDGYTFTNWGGYSFPYEMEACDVTINAVYTINKYTITFDTDGGSEIASITADYNSVVTLPDNPTREHFTFVGWDSTFPSTMPLNGMTLKAIWENIIYTITFDTNGGNEIIPISEIYGSTIQMPDIPTKMGYTFIGWSDKEDLSSLITNPDTMYGKNVTLYAIWAINQYQLTFIFFDDVRSSEYVDYDSIITIPDIPTRNGYRFNGWDSDILTNMPDRDLIYTANWIKNNYSIYFNSNGGSEVFSITTAYNENIIKPVDPTKDGYTFAGWFDNQEFTIPTVFDKMGYVNKTVYAKWDINTVTITFNTNGGTAIEPISLDYNSDVTPPSNPTKTGYTFINWDKQVPSKMPAESITINAIWEINTYSVTYVYNNGSSSTTEFYEYNALLNHPTPVKEGNDFVSWTPSYDRMPASNITMTATWQVKAYRIIYMLDSTTEYMNEYVLFGATITLPTDPVVSGKTFNGWKDAPSIMPAHDVVLTAEFILNEVSLSFNSNGGSAVSEIRLIPGSAVPVVADPTRVGYTFNGWEPSVPSIMPSENLTIIAKWTVNSYTITFETVGGTSISAITQNFGSTIVKPSDPEKTGYTFNGWDKVIPTTMPSEDVLITATWSINSYNVYFETNGGTSIDTRTVVYGNSIGEINNPTKLGYTFIRWDGLDSMVMPANDLYLTAVWDIINYTITYNLDNGNASNPTSYNVNTETFTISNPTKDRYDFIGWTTDTVSTYSMEITITKGSIGSITLTAHYNYKPYTVAFLPNGAEGNERRQIIAYNTDTILQPNNYTYDKHRFLGWSKTSDGSVLYTDQQQINNIGDAGSTVYLYAIWMQQYTVNFLNRNNVIVKTEVVDSNTSATPPTPETVSGYTFSGWSNSYTNVTYDRNLTPEYEANTYRYSISYKYDCKLSSSIVPCTPSLTYESGQALTGSIVYDTTFRVKAILATGYSFYQYKIDSSLYNDHVNATGTVSTNTHVYKFAYNIEIIVYVKLTNKDITGDLEETFAKIRASVAISGPNEMVASVSMTATWDNGTTTTSNSVNLTGSGTVVLTLNNTDGCFLKKLVLNVPHKVNYLATNMLEVNSTISFISSDGYVCSTTYRAFRASATQSLTMLDDTIAKDQRIVVNLTDTLPTNRIYLARGTSIKYHIGGLRFSGQPDVLYIYDGKEDTMGYLSDSPLFVGFTTINNMDYTIELKGNGSIGTTATVSILRKDYSDDFNTYSPYDITVHIVDFS